MTGSVNDKTDRYFGFENHKPTHQAPHTGDTNIIYTSFVNEAGEWYIMKSVASGDGLTVTYTYCKGTSGYTTAWAARETLSYGRYDEIFK